MTSTISGSENAFAMLRRFARRRDGGEQCEFCNAAIPAGHRHLLEVAARRIVCVCNPCALRFENVVGRWKLIPRDAKPLLEFRMSDADWEALNLPINLAFFFHSTSSGKTAAVYPSPAGATESLLPLPNWASLVNANPVLARMEPDVEALLANRIGTAHSYFLAPIDTCFELVGLVRVHWRGLSGGERVWREIESFFARLATGEAIRSERSLDTTGTRDTDVAAIGKGDSCPA